MQKKPPTKSVLARSWQWLSSNLWEDKDASAAWHAITKLVVPVATIMVIAIIAAHLLPFGWTVWFIFGISGWYGAQGIRSRLHAGVSDGTTKPPREKYFRGIRREVIVDKKTGPHILRLRQWEKQRLHIWNHATHTPIERRITLADSAKVNERLACKGMPMPIDGETEILYFLRLHWLSHGPVQILITIVTIGITFIATRSVNLASGGVCLLIGTIAYLLVWQRWAYTFFIITNKRTFRIYAPPLLPDQHDSVVNRKISGCNVRDMSFLRYIKIPGSGIIFGETSATDTDAWFRKGIRWLRYHQDAKRLIDNYAS